MMRSLLVALAAGLAIAQPSFAQSPYAGLQARAVKALSDQQIADLKAGRGMGLALPADSTVIPGPAICWNWPTRSASPTHSGRRCAACSTP